MQSGEKAVSQLLHVPFSHGVFQTRCVLHSPHPTGLVAAVLDSTAINVPSSLSEPHESAAPCRWPWEDFRLPRGTLAHSRAGHVPSSLGPSESCSGEGTAALGALPCPPPGQESRGPCCPAQAAQLAPAPRRPRNSVRRVEPCPGLTPTLGSRESLTPAQDKAVPARTWCAALLGDPGRSSAPSTPAEVST